MIRRTPRDTLTDTVFTDKTLFRSTSPLGTLCSFKPEVMARDAAGRLEAQLTVGHPPFTVDLAISDDDGAMLPWDGRTQGRLLVRGPGVDRKSTRLNSSH